MKKNHKDYTIVRRHFITLFAKLVKAVFFLIIGLTIYYVTLNIKGNLGPDTTIYVVLPIILVIIIYSFIKIIFAFWENYNEMMIIHNDQIIMIKASLILMDDIEVIDAYRLMKIDSFADGFWANLLGYGNIVLEQQKDNVRIFHFVAKPYKILALLKDQRNKVLDDRRKKYLMKETDDVIEDVRDSVKNIRNY
ncbi:MAG: hypothetical protein PHG82_02985 [Candidatus Gracilibacteria bacterium]|nr:hypothetical protein [Candidatus Gracilibacteria bacterium]